VKTLEVVITPHAQERLSDQGRFPVPPELPSNVYVHLWCLRSSAAGAKTWMCAVKNGFLLGHVCETKRRWRFIVRTAISRGMFHRSQVSGDGKYIPISSHRVWVSKLTLRAPRKRSRLKDPGAEP
jgi:hypothetical protein